MSTTAEPRSQFKEIELCEIGRDERFNTLLSAEWLLMTEMTTGGLYRESHHLLLVGLVFCLQMEYIFVPGSSGTEICFVFKQTFWKKLHFC